MIGCSALLPLTYLPTAAHTATAWLVLGQAGGNNQQNRPVSLQQSFDIIVSLGWLVAAVLLLIIVAFLLRKWLLRDDVTGAGAQFTMADLRQMRDEGLMSPEEFDRAKMFLVSRGKALLEVEAEENRKDENAQADGKAAKGQKPEHDEAEPNKPADKNVDDTQDAHEGPKDEPSDPNKNPPG